jgi:spore germination protein GerM
MKKGARERIRNPRWLIILPFGIILLAAIAAVGLWLSFREKDISAPPIAREKIVPIQEKREFVLYFGDPQNTRLVAEKRAISFLEGPSELAMELINALVEGPRDGGSPTIPSRTHLKALYITADGTAVVDFSPELVSNHPGGVKTELLTIFSVVKTLTRNIPQVKRVKFLVEGAEIESLAGHVDCLRPFSVAPSWIEGAS